MANTFDTSRVGGGTYELAQDANGNYKLKSVGFNQVNKLDLPDLPDVAATTKKATEDTIKTQTTEVFKPTNVYQSGDGDGGKTYTDYDRKPPEAKVKVASPRDVLDPRDTRSPADIQNLQTAQQNYKDASVAYNSDFGTPADKAKMDAANNTIMDARQNYGATTQYNDNKTTGLQKVQSAVQNTVGNVVDSVKNNKALQVAGTVLGAIANPVFAGAKMVAGSLTNEYQRDINNANKNALSSLGYKTNYELGNMSDPGRIAGNPATSAFAGLNAVSAFGDVTVGAQNRVDTRTNIGQARVDAKYGKDSKKSKDFAKTTADYKAEIEAQKAAAERGKQNAKDARDNRSKDKDGNTMGGSCFIAGTKVTMSDGTIKNIENIVVGDKVKGHKEDNTVIKLDPTLLADRKLYSFNNNEHYFFTSEHPFMTEEGWKSVKPEKTKERDGIELYNQLKGELKIGDKLVTEDGSIEITEIKSKEINNPDMPLYNFNVSNDSSYIADDYVVHNKGCFIKGTLVTMADGSTKPVEQVDLGDEVAEGGSVFAVGKFLNTELYDYKGVKVSGSHMVNEDNVWMRVKDTKHGKSLGDDLNTVYVFGSENRRILINDILFTDYFEINEQDKLMEDPEDFFNNWKDYGNDVDVDNVATLNINYEI